MTSTLHALYIGIINIMFYQEPLLTVVEMYDYLYASDQVTQNDQHLIYRVNALAGQQEN